MAPADRDAAITALKKYFSNHRLLLRDMDLVRNTANRLFESKDPESAFRMCRDLAGLSATLDRAVAIFSRQLKGDLRRQRLVGSQMVVDGKTVDGTPFHWDSNRGKVVLVDFWFIGCSACVEELPHIKEMYQRYHDSGFDVVGISVDEDKEQLQAFLAKNQIPWTTIQDKTEIGNRARYNVESFPTKILVDRSGKVLWLDDADGNPVDEKMIKQGSTRSEAHAGKRHHFSRSDDHSAFPTSAGSFVPPKPTLDSLVRCTSLSVNCKRRVIMNGVS